MPPKRGFADPFNMAGGDSDSEGDMANMMGGMPGMMGGGHSGFDPSRFTNPNYSREYLATLPAQIRKRVNGLLGLDKKFVELKKQYEDNKAELLRKFEEKAAPLHQERKGIVSGETAITDEQVNAGKEGEEEHKDVDVSAPAEIKKDADNLTNFWLKALQRHVIVNDMISERDEEIIKFVTDITCTSLKAPANGFIVRFEFAKNDFFTNTALTKTFHLKEIFDELTVERVEGTKIEWTSEDKNVTVEVVKKKQKAKVKGKVVHRTIEKKQKVDSFFRFFSEGPIQGEGGEKDEGEDVEDGEEFEELDEDQWMGLAHVLRDKIIPYAVEYYTGEAPDGSSDLEDDDEFGEEEEEEEEEEDMAPVRAPAGGRGAGGKRAPAGKGAAGGQQQDCKQQ